jgi:regulator of protease activity HflC (stomatin/prohibitin superfamily)
MSRSGGSSQFRTADRSLAGFLRQTPPNAAKRNRDLVPEIRRDLWRRLAAFGVKDLRVNVRAIDPKAETQT